MKFVDQSQFEDDGLDINITPLIDIVFLLLIFFMVSTTFVETAGIDISLPSAASAPVKKEAEPLSISIARDGAVFLGKHRVQLEELSGRLREKLAGGAAATLIVRADRAADHGTVVEVMDRARTAGMKKLAVAVAPEKK